MKITILQTEYIEATLENDFLNYKSQANLSMTQEEILEVFEEFTQNVMTLYQQGKVKENSIH